MFDDKLAAIMSSLSPPVTGARPPKGMATPARTPSTTPGLGAKMRAETSRALEQALAKGGTDALAHFGVKAAAVPLARPVPAARGLAMPHPTAATPHPAAPAAAPQPHPGYQLAPHEEAQAQRMRGMSPDQRANELGLGRDAQNAHFMQQHGIAPAGAAPAGSGMLSRMGAGAQRFMRPVKRGLGLAALAGAGALAYGLHRQNQEDRDARDLVYAPMEGTY